jgi:hypothetical protein
MASDEYQTNINSPRNELDMLLELLIAKYRARKAATQDNEGAKMPEWVANKNLPVVEAIKVGIEAMDEHTKKLQAQVDALAGDKKQLGTEVETMKNSLLEMCRELRETQQQEALQSDDYNTDDCLADSHPIES